MAIVEVDLDDMRDIELGRSGAGRPYRSVLALARRGREPVGFITLSCEGSLITADGLREAARRSLGDRLVDRSPYPSPASGASLPTLTAVVTTCAMPELAARCVASILACEHPPDEVLVVDNRPGRRDTAGALRARFPGDERVRCIPQPSRGLSVARNTGLAQARSEVVAFTDDDVVVDPLWCGAIAGAFAGTSAVACVTGPILPLALDTEQQLIHERLAGYGKGFERRLYRLDHPPAGDPLYPYAAGRFGSGANTALRADAGRELGGFDVDLGAGTPSRGGEDLDLFVRVLISGAVIAYEPCAVVRHEHDVSQRDLRRRAFSYGIGLTAMLTKQLIAGHAGPGLLRRAPQGVRHAIDPASTKNAGKGPDYPASLNALERLGMLIGPLAYGASRLRRPSAQSGDRRASAIR